MLLQTKHATKKKDHMRGSPTDVRRTAWNATHDVFPLLRRASLEGHLAPKMGERGSEFPEESDIPAPSLAQELTSRAPS